MKKTDFKLTKYYFESQSKKKISRSTWYNYLGILKINGYDPTTENISLLAQIRSVTPNLNAGFQGYETFKKQVNLLSDTSLFVTRVVLYTQIRNQISDVSVETVRRWFRKVGVKSTDNKALSVVQIQQILVLAYVYQLKKGIQNAA
jgi:hypothetical protein